MKESIFNKIAINVTVETVSKIILSILAVALGVISAFEGCDSSDPKVRSSLAEYSWDELSAISKEIAMAGSDREGYELAAYYNLSDKDGNVSGRSTKEVVLEDKYLHEVVLAGIRHDKVSDTESYGALKAGLSFVFADAIDKSEWASIDNDSMTVGWGRSDVREKLDGTYLSFLPDDLESVVVAVDKPTNNYGAPDQGTIDSKVVTATSDRLWLLSAVEIRGTSFNNRNWKNNDLDWCNTVANAEGSQYALFAEKGVKTSEGNDVLRRQFRQEAVDWWLRTPNPHIRLDALEVLADGMPDGDTGVGTQLGIVPGFCV